MTLNTVSPRRLRTWKYIISFTLLGISLSFCFHKVVVGKTSVSDFAAYWTASRLLLTGQNPYDVDKVFALEKATAALKLPLVMRNPPWLIPLILPLGLVSYKMSRALWAIPQIAILMGAALWTWKHYARSDSARWIAWLVTITSLPCILVLIMGQSTPLILLGVIGFLYCECNRRSNSWLQALCLVLIALKPHLLYLFWVALFLWIFDSFQQRDILGAVQKRGGLLWKFFAALLAASALPLIIDRHIWAEYYTYLQRTPILQEVIPTFGNLLRLHTHLRWTQFLPMFLGGGWLLWHWSRNRRNWSWSEQMPALLLASVLTTTYSWFYDQVILLPAVLYAVAQNFPTRNRKHLITVLAMCLEANALVLIIGIHTNGLDDFKFLWIWPVWGLLFTGLRWLARPRHADVLKPVVKNSEEVFAEAA